MCGNRTKLYIFEKKEKKPKVMKGQFTINCCFQFALHETRFDFEN